MFYHCRRVFAALMPPLSTTLGPQGVPYCPSLPLARIQATHCSALQAGVPVPSVESWLLWQDPVRSRCFDIAASRAYTLAAFLSAACTNSYRVFRCKRMINYRPRAREIKTLGRSVVARNHSRRSVSSFLSGNVLDAHCDASVRFRLSLFPLLSLI